MAKRTSRRGFRKKSKQYSKKYSRKKSRKYTRKTYRKKNKRTKKRKNNRKIVKKNLVGGGMEDNEKHYPPASPSSPSSHLALLNYGSSATAAREAVEAGSPPPPPGKWYGNEVNIGEFLKQKLTETANSNLDSENLKEVRIASFTNFYRLEIYRLVNIIDDYLGDLADVVVSGGDGLNNILEPKDRLVSPDVDVKVIIKHESVKNPHLGNWLNVYRLVVVMTEYIVDYIVCCLNGTESDHIKMHLPHPYISVLAVSAGTNKYDEFIVAAAANPDADTNAAEYIRSLFYNGGTVLDFLIEGEEPFDTLLQNDEFNECIGNPWNRRTSNMPAGGKEAPFTLMNVKLITIDLRYKGIKSYYECLAGVLDIVIAVPGHIGHGGMLEDGKNYGYENTSENIWCINMIYYIYEMVTMIQYGLRTRNGKLYKDLARCNTLLNLWKIPGDKVIVLVNAAKVQMGEGKGFPKYLVDVTQQLIDAIEITVAQVTIEAMVTEIMKIVDVDVRVYEDHMNKQISKARNVTTSGGTDLDAKGDIDNRRDIEDGQDDKNCDVCVESCCAVQGGRKRSTNKRRRSNKRIKSKKNINKQDGGGWKDENSNTIGKVLQSLNILDFFTVCGNVYTVKYSEIPQERGQLHPVSQKSYYNEDDVPWIRVMSSNGDGNVYYYIELKEHDKILKGEDNNFIHSL